LRGDLKIFFFPTGILGCALGAAHQTLASVRGTVVQTYIGHSTISGSPLKSLKKSQWLFGNGRIQTNGEINVAYGKGGKKQMVKSMVPMARVEKNKWLNQWCLWQWWKKTIVKINGDYGNGAKKRTDTKSQKQHKQKKE